MEGVGALKTNCDAGCQKAFEVESFNTTRIGDGIDKVYFACSNCKHEYVAFYTDPEIRRLQAKIRRVQQQLSNPRATVKAAMREAEIKQQIKEKMDELRTRIERKDG
jgi:transcription initiation factor IIE alpha subunit